MEKQNDGLNWDKIRFYFVLCCLLFLGISTLFGVWKGQADYRNAHIENWKPTDGVVVLTSEHWSGGRTMSVSYGVQYNYTVTKQLYSSNRLFFPKIENNNSSGTTTNKDPHLKKGDHVTVWYNPKNPGDAVLSKEMQ